MLQRNAFKGRYLKQNMKIIKLEKLSDGKKLTWQCEIVGSKVTYTWGIFGMKMQTKVDVYKEGKNIGKKNEKTPEDVALFEAETTALKKIDKGYKLVEGKINEHATKATKDFSVPEPMLAHKYADQGHKLGKHFFAQKKYDGIRGIFDTNTGKGYTRSGKPMLGCPHIEEAILKLGIKDGWIDGELYSHDLSFEQIISVTKKTKTLADEKLRKKIILVVFDAVMPGNTMERHNWVKKNVKGKYLEISEMVPCTPETVEKIHDKFVEEGYEGIMLRATDGKYEHKRSYGLLKFKKFFDEECKIVDFEKNEHQETLGSLWFVYSNGGRFKTGLKMSHEMRQEIWDNKKKYLGKLATVRFQELTDKEKVPRFGVTVAIRDYE